MAGTRVSTQQLPENPPEPAGSSRLASHGQDGNAPPQDLRAKLEIARQEVARLEKLVEEEDKLRALEKSELEELEDGPLRRHQISTDSEDSDEDFAFRDMPILEPYCLPRKREEWLAHLNLMFRYIPKKYKRDEIKIIQSLEYMNEECRSRWYGHVKLGGSKDGVTGGHDWDYFKEWTMSLTQGGPDLNQRVMIQLDEATQRPNQPPSRFLYYIETLESDLVANDEERKALAFYAKLEHRLREAMYLCGDLPTTRDKMVALANRHWYRMKDDQISDVAPTEQMEHPPKRTRRRAAASSRRRNRNRRHQLPSVY